MRKIKFRFFINQKKMMVYPDDSWLLDGDGHLWIVDDSQNFLVDPFKGGHILMQYTGLEDKNGKEIYEGDIVELQYQWRGVVTWFQEWAGAWFYGYYLVRGKNPEARISFPQTRNDFEVIGNIYENPELLK